MGKVLVPVGPPYLLFVLTIHGEQWIGYFVILEVEDSKRAEGGISDLIVCRRSVGASDLTILLSHS